MSTFTIHNTAFRGSFRVKQRPAGDFAVDRYNSTNGRIERWGLYSSRELATGACRCVNREIAAMGGAK